MKLLRLPQLLSSQRAIQRVHTRTTRDRRRHASRVVSAFIVVTLSLHVGLSLALDTVLRTARDPEYGRRYTRLQQLKSENLTIALGSSRVSMGVRPLAFRDPETMPVFNFSIVGSGPVMEVMTLRRLLHDGVRPARIVCEYWPPFMREDAEYQEELRIDKHRLFPCDREFVRDYFETREHTLAIMRNVRRNPWYEHRIHLMNQISPGFLHHRKRIDFAWDKLDARGWLPGRSDESTPAIRTESHRLAKSYYTPLFETWSLHPKAVRATRELIETCQRERIPLTFLWLPESSEFRSWYPSSVLHTSTQFWKELGQTPNCTLIDAREWVDDVYLVDGFHLTQTGAARFSERLGEELRRLAK
jgi:hypothetical protein